MNSKKPTKTDILIKQLDTSEDIVICINYKNCISCYSNHNNSHVRKHACKLSICPRMNINVKCTKV